MDSAGYNWGDDAKEDLWSYLVSMRDEDAVGSVMAMVRGKDGLTTVPVDLNQAESIDDVLLHLAEIDCELLVVDGGNKHGDCWKAVYHTISNTLSTFSEQIDLRPKPAELKVG